MMTKRRTFHRSSPAERRSDLIAATQECIVQGGVGAATIRKVAEIADVTPGLVRHYFPDKKALLCATYQATMCAMTEQITLALNGCERGAAAKLRIFIETSLRPPVMQQRNHQLWASFRSLINADPTISAMHREAYLDYRNECQRLIRDLYAELSIAQPEKRIEGYAIAVNAVLDGLWLEGCLNEQLFVRGELAELGVATVQAILGLETL